MGTVCGLPSALSLIESDALSAPPPMDVKVMLMVQDAFAARAVPHVLVWLKSAALVPVKLMLEMVRVVLPVLVSITGWAALSPIGSSMKFKVLGNRFATAKFPWRNIDR